MLTLAVDPTIPAWSMRARVALAGQGNGVYKSMDGGLTWSAANRGMLDYRIAALAIDPTDPKIGLCGSDKGELFKSTMANELE